MTYTFSQLHDQFLHTEDLMKKLDIYHYITNEAINNKTFKDTIDMVIYNETIGVLSKLPIQRKYDKETIAIIGFNDSCGFWDPTSVEKGLPGSEECVVYLSNELVKRGHRVVMYLNPPPDSIYSNFMANPRWVPISLYSEKSHLDHYDIGILWRNTYYSLAKTRANKVYYWSHDINNGDPNMEMPAFDGALILSKYFESVLDKHKGFKNIPRVICGNGVDLSQFKTPKRYTNPLSLGYYSNYVRGLEILLHAWDQIHEIFPTATLAICYGRQHWGTIDDKNFKSLCDKIDALKEKGVVEYGKVGHQKLADIMEQTSIWAYPCVEMGETFCITAVKTQLAGCIPVASRIGALNETIHPDAPCLPTIDNIHSVINYVQLLIKVMRYLEKTPREIVDKQRDSYIEFAKQFSWEKCTDKILKFVKS